MLGRLLRRPAWPRPDALGGAARWLSGGGVPRVNTLATVREVLQAQPSVSELQSEGSSLRGRVREIEGRFAEEERSRQHSIFSVVRALCEGGANVHLTDRRHRPALEYALACASRSHAASQATLRGLSWRRPPEPAPVPDGYACARVLREWVEVAGTRSRSSTG